MIVRHGNDNYDLREDILSREEWEGVNEVIKVLRVKMPTRCPKITH